MPSPGLTVKGMKHKSTRIGWLAATAAVTLTALAISACGGGGGTSAPPTTASGKPATVGLADEGNLGEILVDTQGRSLYLFQKDIGTRSECTGACAAAWPPLRDARKPVVGTDLSASKLGTTPRSDGKAQVTYNGHPLYLYSGDHKPGETNGQGLNVFGGGWFALSAAGNMVSGTGTGGGGY
jgi:predicted lipoprotein with Yx(FWY)xxD motif